MDKKDKMAVTPKGLKIMAAGVLVMIAGFVLMAGGGVKDPRVFNYGMFNFQRLVAAPIVIASGVVVIVSGIMGKFRKDGEEK